MIYLITMFVSSIISIISIIIIRIIFQLFSFTLVFIIAVNLFYHMMNETDKYFYFLDTNSMIFVYFRGSMNSL